MTIVRNGTTVQVFVLAVTQDMVNQLKVFVQALHQQPFQSMTIVLNMDTLMPNKNSTASGLMDAKKFVLNVTAIII